MPWEYSQSSGELKHNGTLIDVGFSGSGYAKNAPNMEYLKHLGPIPRGSWFIGPAYYSGVEGPFTMNLCPYGHSAYGRAIFRIQGNSSPKSPDTAGEAIILSRTARMRIAESGDSALRVVW